MKIQIFCTLFKHCGPFKSKRLICFKYRSCNLKTKYGFHGGYLQGVNNRNLNTYHVIKTTIKRRRLVSQIILVEKELWNVVKISYCLLFYKENFKSQFHILFFFQNISRISNLFQFWTANAFLHVSFAILFY